MGVPLPARRAALLIAAVLLMAPVVHAVELGVVDYQLVFDRYEGTADAQRTLDRELKDWETEAKDMRDEITRLSDEIESQRLMLSEERLREKQDQLDRKREEYETFTQSIFGVNGKAAQRNAELTQPIAERILEVIARIGKEKNLQVILDAGTGGVVWAEDDVNLTDIVLDDLSLTVSGGASPTPDAGTGQ